jgi:hypothetical protein
MKDMYPEIQNGTGKLKLKNDHYWHVTTFDYPTDFLEEERDE